MVERNKPMGGRVCMVTGATGGIGKVTAHALAQQGATVIVVGRSRTKAVATVEQITRQTGNSSVEYLLADQSVQEEIRRLAAEFKRRHDRLHVLVNNAGAFFMSRYKSADGIEMTFALNHLGYFLLTNLLLDVIKASAPARIINVSSAAHENAQIDFDDVQGEQKFSGWQAYGQSKLANVLFTYELARRLEGTGVTANALHPGFVATNFGANNFGIIGRGVKRVMNLVAGISPEEGAETNIYLASSPAVEGVTAQYFVNKKAVRSSEASYDEEAARRLWEISAEMVGLPVHA
ncbi:MAG: SDR family oxidoreductase [Anaerolineae bacterium]